MIVTVNIITLFYDLDCKKMIVTVKNVPEAETAADAEQALS